RLPGATHRRKLLHARITQIPQVGGVDLRVTSKASNEAIQEGGIEPDTEPPSHFGRQPGPADVEHVHMTLDPDPLARHLVRVENCGHYAALLLLGGEALDDNVVSKRKG